MPDRGSGLHRPATIQSRIADSCRVNATSQCPTYQRFYQVYSSRFSVGGASDGEEPTAQTGSSGGPGTLTALGHGDNTADASITGTRHLHLGAPLLAWQRTRVETDNKFSSLIPLFIQF